MSVDCREVIPDHLPDPSNHSQYDEEDLDEVEDPENEAHFPKNSTKNNQNNNSQIKETNS